MQEAQKKEHAWTRNQRVLIAWLALPKNERKPATQRLLADQFGIDEARLSEWKKLPGFWVEVNRQARAGVQEDVAEVLATIRYQAKRGNLPFVNMVLSMAGMGVELEAAGKGPSVYVIDIGAEPEDNAPSQE